MQWPCNSPSSGLPPSLSSTPNFYKCRTPWIKPLPLDQLLSLKLIITFYHNGSFMFLGIGKYDWSPYAEVNDFLISLLEMVVVMALLSEPEMIPTLILLFCCTFQKIALELFLLRFLWWLSIPSEGRGGTWKMLLSFKIIFGNKYDGRACQPCCRGCSSGRTPFPSLNLNFMTF